MRESGVYQIVNKVNGKRYVGSTTDLQNRWAAHRSLLRHGKHHNVYLQHAWDLYGGKAFAFSALEYVLDLERLVEREQHYFDVLQPEYNIAPAAGCTIGYRHTPDARERMSEAATGRVLSAETRQKISKAKRGAGNENAKLTQHDVRQIKLLLAESILPQYEIAAMYGVDSSQISKINRGVNWSHIQAAN